MQNIGAFFEKFKNLLLTDTNLRQEVSDAIFKVLETRIDPKFIIIKKTTAIVPSFPVLRSELFLKKTRIIEELRKSNPKNQINDIH